MTPLKDIVDAATARLNSLPLPAHYTAKYVQPRAPRTDVNAAQLFVYPERVEFELVATPGEYALRHRVIVKWWERAFVGAESNTQDQALAQAALVRAQAIMDEMLEWADGIPGINDNVVGTMIDAEFDLVEGLVWEALFRIDVEVC